MRDKSIVLYSLLLKRFRDLFGVVQTPNVIVTDRNEGLSLGIRDVFLGIS